MRNRILRVNKNIQQILGKIFQRELDLPQGVFITITKVETSADLKTANAFVSILPEKNQKGIFNQIKRKKKIIQRLLGENLVMKNTPSLSLILDTAPARVDRLQKLLKEISKKDNESRNERTP